MRLAVATALCLLPAIAHADALSMRFGWCIDAPDAAAAKASGSGSAEDIVLGRVEGGDVRVRKCRGTMPHYGDVAPATVLYWSDPKTKRVVRQVLGEDYAVCYELRAKGFKKSVVSDPAPVVGEDAPRTKAKRCTSTEAWTFDPALRRFTSKKDPGGMLRAYQTDLDDGDLAFARGRLLDLEDDPGLEWTKRYYEAAHRAAAAKSKAGAKSDAAGIALAALLSPPAASEKKEGRTFALGDRLWLPIDAWAVEIVNDLAFFAAEGGAAARALPLLKQVTDADPARAVAHLNVGDASRDAGLEDDARAAWKRYVELMEKAGKKAKIPARVRKADMKPVRAADAMALARAAIAKQELEIARGWMRAAEAGPEDLFTFQEAACATGERDVIRGAFGNPPVAAPKLDATDPRQQALIECMSR